MDEAPHSSVPEGSTLSFVYEGMFKAVARWGC